MQTGLIMWTAKDFCYSIPVLCCCSPAYIHSILYFKVFLDELNTSSCLGLFKELIVDRTLNGEVRTFTIYTLCDYIHTVLL